MNAGGKAHLLAHQVLHIHLVLLGAGEGAGQPGQGAVRLEGLEVCAVQVVLLGTAAAKKQPAGSWPGAWSTLLQPLLPAHVRGQLGAGSGNAQLLAARVCSQDMCIDARLQQGR